MSRFTKTFSFTTNFEDDVVSVTMTRMTRKDAMSLKRFYKVGEDGKQSISFEDAQQMTEVMSDILPEHVKSFSGLKSAEGDDLTFSEVYDEAYFLPLVQDIMSELFSNSYSNGEQEKKLGKAQPSISASPDNIPDSLSQD